RRIPLGALERVLPRRLRRRDPRALQESLRLPVRRPTAERARAGFGALSPRRRPRAPREQRPMPRLARHGGGGDRAPRAERRRGDRRPRSSHRGPRRRHERVLPRPGRQPARVHRVSVVAERRATDPQGYEWTIRERWLPKVEGLPPNAAADAFDGGGAG